MLEHAMEFYKNLFGKEDRNNIRLQEGFWGDDEKVSHDENLELESDLSENEILLAIKGSYSEGAPGPDGFFFMFYQKFWSIIKKDFMALVRGFNQGNLNLRILNYAKIILIPKEEGGNTLKKYRPISLINCSLKFLQRQ
jgi:hypothetical protein